MSVEGQIWLELSCLPDVIFGGVYIPPDDSIYYDVSHFGFLNAKVRDRKRVIVMGDFNGRVGEPPTLNLPDSFVCYKGIKDTTVTAQGRRLIDVCENNSMVVANHFSHKDKTSGGNLSYRIRDTWVSELDLCLINYQFIDVIKKLETNQDVRGSDHAPLCIELDFSHHLLVPQLLLLERASNLGQTYYRPPVAQFSKKSTSYKLVDIHHFSTVMEAHPPPDLFNGQVENLSDVLSVGCQVIDQVSKRLC